MQAELTRVPFFPQEDWNNLAQVLLDLGRRHEAGQAIARAVALGGERLSDDRVLQQEIDRKSASGPLK